MARSDDSSSDPRNNFFLDHVSSTAVLNTIELAIIQSIQEEDIVRILCRLIQERSDYPPGDTRSAIAIVEQELDEAGIDCKKFARIPARESLVTELGAESSAPVLLFHSHIDTVPAGDPARWSHSPFIGVIDDGLIFGRGAGDDKGSVVVQLAAFLALARAGAVRGCQIRLAVVADEESGGEMGTRWLHEEGHLQADAIVIGEQTHNHISVAERVACGIDLTVLGKSAHGATPWEGENAIMKVCRALTYLHEHLEPLLDERKHPFLPSPTLNVGQIEGGIQWNIVPERCVVKMDRRLLPGENREQALSEIRKVLDRFSDEQEPLIFELHSEGEVAPNVDTDPENPFVKMAEQALSDLVEEPRPLIGYVQTSDGRWFVGDGVPIIHFGPGDPALAHAVDEHVAVKQLVEGAQFLALLALRWDALFTPI